MYKCASCVCLMPVKVKNSARYSVTEAKDDCELTHGC